MFIQQGARQFEIFTGKPAPEEEMFRVVLHALRQQADAVHSGTADGAEPTPRPKKASDTAAPPAAPAKSASANAVKKSARSK
jgi:3-dehydroquinate dehydratase/shikimate dehydrogenase